MKKTRVMVVDDQFVARQLFELYLKSSERYELVHMVESAAFAETFMKSDAVDLVLMDILMNDDSNGLDAAVIGILGLSTLVALAGSAEGAGMLYAACILCLISGVLQLIAGIKGAKHCQNPDMAHSCMIWGIVVAVFCVLGNLFYVIGGKGFDVTSLLTGLLLPALYIYGAVLNKKQEDPMEPAI